MKKLILFILIAFVLISSTAWATDYYAAPTVAGGEDCSTVNDPGLIATCIALLSAGDTLYLADGTYTGDNSMITPGATIDGSNGSPITIRATNEGEVDIDGEGVRDPVTLDGNDYITLIGFNAHSAGDGNTGSSVFQVKDSDNVILQRLIGWDAYESVDEAANNHIFNIVYDSDDVLVEDCAGWGSARKIFSLWGTDVTRPSGITFRRCFWRWTHWLNSMYKLGGTIGYYCNADIIYENCIGTWDETAGSHAGNPAAILGNDEDDSQDGGRKIYGSIFYQLAAQTGAPLAIFNLSSDSNHGGTDIKDVIIYTDRAQDGYLKPFGTVGQTNLTASYLTVMGAWGWQYDGGAGATRYGMTAGVPTGTIDYCVITDSLADDGAVDNGAEYDYIAFNNNDANYPGAAPANITTTDPDLVGNCGNILQYDCTTARPEVDGNDVGAQIQYRYVDGVLSGDALWPWPMNDRIAVALVDSGYDTKGLDGAGNTDLTNVIFTLDGGSEPAWIPPPGAGSISGIVGGGAGSMAGGGSGTCVGKTP